MMYTAEVKGNFVEKQSVEAASAEEAEAKFLNNEGETLERTDASDLEVSNVEEVEDEAPAAPAIDPDEDEAD